MKFCHELGEWIKKNVEEPVEKFFERLVELCEEARRWVEEEVRKPIEVWREQQEERCEEEKCAWGCLCCNKWICWIATFLAKFIEWIVETVGEWLVETLCKLVVTLFRMIVMAIIEVVTWVTLLVVCLLEAACALFVLSAALAMLAMLVTIVTQANPTLIPVAISFALAALAMAKWLCGDDWCRIVAAIGWALKWAIVIGAGYAIGTLNGVSALIVAIYGGALAALIVWLEPGKCRVPGLLDRP